MWLPKITKFIDKKRPALVAVGTGHLFGESNIINSIKMYTYPCLWRGYDFLKPFAFIVLLI